MDYSKLTKKIVSYTAGVSLAGLTFLGSCTNHLNDCPPFYLNKTGTSGGIALALIAKVSEDATFNGPVISLFNINSGKINGGNIALVGSASEGSNSCVNGLEFSVIGNLPGRKQESLATKINGVQLSVGLNESRAGSKGLQIAAYNQGKNMESNDVQGVILNVVGYK